jgi:serine/threonine-protein kinase RsbW
MSEVIQDSIVVQAQTANLQAVREFMSRQAKASALPDREKNKVVLAVDEAVANIVKHAYQMSGSGEVIIRVQADEEKFEVFVYDSGIRFDPAAVKNPDMSEHVRLGKKTGLGIFLMRQIMDEVIYNFREGARNELHLIKYVSPPAEPSKGPSPA